MKRNEMVSQSKLLWHFKALNIRVDLLTFFFLIFTKWISYHHDHYKQYCRIISLFQQNHGDNDDARVDNYDHDENKWMDKRRLKALIRRSLIDLSHNIFRFYHHDHRFKLNRQFFFSFFISIWSQDFVLKIQVFGAGDNKIFRNIRSA